MSATIRRNYAPDFDGANPQGVQWDSLESFISIGAGKGGETPALRAFLRAQRRQLYYMYCSHIIYIIYFISLQCVCVMWRIVVQWRGNANTKIKNKHQGTMTKGEWKWRRAASLRNMPGANMCLTLMKFFVIWPTSCTYWVHDVGLFFCVVVFIVDNRIQDIYYSWNKHMKVPKYINNV